MAVAFCHWKTSDFFMQQRRPWPLLPFKNSTVPCSQRDQKKGFQMADIRTFMDARKDHYIMVFFCHAANLSHYNPPPVYGATQGKCIPARVILPVAMFLSVNPCISKRQQLHRKRVPSSSTKCQAASAHQSVVDPNCSIFINSWRFGGVRHRVVRKTLQLFKTVWCLYNLYFRWAPHLHHV
jgi:hypothetical protein